MLLTPEDASAICTDVPEPKSLWRQSRTAYCVAPPTLAGPPPRGNCAPRNRQLLPRLTVFGAEPPDWPLARLMFAIVGVPVKLDRSSTRVSPMRRPPSTCSVPLQLGATTVVTRLPFSAYTLSATSVPPPSTLYSGPIPLPVEPVTQFTTLVPSLEQAYDVDTVSLTLRLELRMSTRVAPMSAARTPPIVQTVEVVQCSMWIPPPLDGPEPAIGIARPPWPVIVMSRISASDGKLKLKTGGNPWSPPVQSRRVSGPSPSMK